MSGGDLNYIYLKLNEAIDEIEHQVYKFNNKYIISLFIDHLKKVSNVLKAIEYQISGDSSDAEKEILEFFGEAYTPYAIEQLKKEAKDIINKLEELTK